MTNVKTLTPSKHFPFSNEVKIATAPNFAAAVE